MFPSLKWLSNSREIMLFWESRSFFDLYVFAPYKVIRIPESRKFLLVESGILGSGIQNPAFGIQDPAKKGNSESTCWKSISNRINGFHPHPCNHCTVQFTHVVNRCSNLESVYITEAFKSHRICLEHQYSRYLIVLEHLKIMIWPLWRPVNINLLVVITTVGRWFCKRYALVFP